MRDELNTNVKSDNECMVINTDHSRNEGTHWTCLFINNGTSYYFDPYGFPPTMEIIHYCDEPPPVRHLRFGLEHRAPSKIL